MPHTDLRQCHRHWHTQWRSHWHCRWLITLVIWLGVLASAISETRSQPVVSGGGGDPNLSVPAIINCGKSYSNILRALRDNWESPITYLKKRGYLPKNSELLLANSDADGNELIIQVDGDSRAELQNECDANGNANAVPIRHDENGQELTSAYKSAHDPFAFIVEPQKGFLGTMKDKILGLFGNGKKHGSAPPTDSTDGGKELKLSPQKLNEQKLLAKLPIATAKSKQYQVPFSKDFKPTQHKYGYILDGGNAPHAHKMLHYRKGENVEQELNKSDLPFNDCMPAGQQENFLWMHVKGGTKVNNVITYAKNALDKNECRTFVWSGAGGGVVKTISCAEILKRDYPLYQVTRMSYSTIEESWLPQMDGLEEIVVKRQIPTLHILMSLDAIDDNVSGLQKPGTTTDFWVEHHRSRHSNNNSQRDRKQQQQHQQQQQHGKRGNARGSYGAQQKQAKASPLESGEGHAEQATSSAQRQQQQQQQHQQASTEQRGEFKGKSKHKNRHSNTQQSQQQQQRQPQRQQRQQQTQRQPQQQLEQQQQHELNNQPEPMKS